MHRPDATLRLPDLSEKGCCHVAPAPLPFVDPRACRSSVPLAVAVRAADRLIDVVVADVVRRVDVDAVAPGSTSPRSWTGST